MPTLEDIPNPTRMHLRVREGDEGLVVFVHGWMMNGRLFERLWEAMNSTATFVAVDLAGVGKSIDAEGPIGLEHWAKDIASFLRAQPGPVHLVGHSMGGLLAQMAASEVQDLASLSLLVSVPTAGFPIPEPAATLFAQASESDEARRQVLAASGPDFSRDALDWLASIARECRADAIRVGLEDFQRGAPELDLSTIKCRSTVIGSEDAFLTDDFLRSEIAEALPTGRFVSIGSGGHYPMVEQSEPLARALDSSTQES